MLNFDYRGDGYMSESSGQSGVGNMSFDAANVQPLLPNSYLNNFNSAQYQSAIFQQNLQQQLIHQDQITRMFPYNYVSYYFTQNLLYQDFQYTPPVNELQLALLNQLHFHSQYNSLNSSPATSQTISSNSNFNSSSISTSSPSPSSSSFQFSPSSSSTVHFEYEQPPQQSDQGQNCQFLDANANDNNNSIADIQSLDKAYERLDDLDFGVVPSNYLKHRNKRFRKESSSKPFIMPEVKRVIKKNRRRRLEKLIRETIEELVALDENRLTEMIASNLRASKYLVSIAVDKLGKPPCVKLFIKTLRMQKRGDGEAINEHTGNEVHPWENFVSLAFNSGLPKPILKNLFNEKEPTQSSLILNSGTTGLHDAEQSAKEGEGEMKKPILCYFSKHACKCKSAKHFNLIEFLTKKKKRAGPIYSG